MHVYPDLRRQSLSHTNLIWRSRFVEFTTILPDTGIHRTNKVSTLDLALTLDVAAHLERLSQVKCEVTGVSSNHSAVYHT